jgi:hypothetical protein
MLQAHLLRVEFKYDLESKDSQIAVGTIIKNVRRPAKAAMHCKRSIALVITTAESSTELLTRLRPVLEQLGAVDNYWCHLAPPAVVARHGGLDPEGAQVLQHALASTSLSYRREGRTIPRGRRNQSGARRTSRFAVACVKFGSRPKPNRSYPIMNRFESLDKNRKTSPRNPLRFVVAGIALSLSTLNYRELPPPIRGRLSGQRRRYSERGIHKLRNAPSPLSDPQRLCWRRAEGFMDAAQVEVTDIQRDSCNVVIQFL